MVHRYAACTFNPINVVTAEVTDESIECCHNACFGTADPEPAESRWTHVLPKMHALHVAAIVHAAAAAATSQRGSSGGSRTPDLGPFEVVQGATWLHVMRHVNEQLAVRSVGGSAILSGAEDVSRSTPAEPRVMSACMHLQGE